jgi:hypothetical protein
MGGGARGFYPNTYEDPSGGRGRRKDGRNLIDEWLELKQNDSQRALYVQNKVLVGGRGTTFISRLGWSEMDGPFVDHPNLCIYVCKKEKQNTKRVIYCRLC